MLLIILGYVTKNEINRSSFPCRNREGGLEFFLMCRFLSWREDDLNKNVDAAAATDISAVSTRNLRFISASKKLFISKNVNCFFSFRSFIFCSGHLERCFFFNTLVNVFKTIMFPLSCIHTSRFLKKRRRFRKTFFSAF